MFATMLTMVMSVNVEVNYRIHLAGDQMTMVGHDFSRIYTRRLPIRRLRENRFADERQFPCRQRVYCEHDISITELSHVLNFSMAI